MKLNILTARNDDVIHGVANFNAVEGNGVVYDSTDPNKLKLATNTTAYVLDRDVLDEISLRELVFEPNFKTPVKKGLEATARKVVWMEAEGHDLLFSGTGIITPGTAADTALEWNLGKLRIRQGTNVIAGYLRAQLTPEEGLGTARILVELV